MADEHSTLTEATPASERGGGFPPFQKETFASQLFWLVICFVALYIMVSKLILPRMGTIIAERRDRIAGDLAEAGRMKDQADGAVAAYEKALADARARAQAIAAETRDKLSAAAEANRKELEAKLQGKLADAEKEHSGDQVRRHDQCAQHRPGRRRCHRHPPDRHNPVG